VERDRRRLIRRLLGGAMIVAVVIVSLTGIMLWRLEQAQLDDGLTDVASLDLLATALSERAFENVSITLDGISADLQAENVDTAAALRKATSDEGTFRLLRAKMASVPQLVALAIATSEGDIVNRTRSYPVNQQTNVSDREYFARLRDHPEISAYISPPLKGSDGKLVIYIGKRLNAPNGAFVGIVLGAVHADYFQDLYSNYLDALVGDGKSMALWRTDGLLLARSPVDSGTAIDAAPPDFNRPVPSNGLLSYWGQDPSGNAIAIARRRLENLPLAVEVRQSASAMLAPWNDEFLATGLGGGALLILVGVALWMVMRQLQSQAQIIEERARADREVEAREDIEKARMNAEAAMRDAQQSEARFRDIAEVGSDWIWETDAEHRFTLIAGAHQPKVSLIGKTRWAQAGADPETDAVWREHKAVLDARQPFRQFRFALNLPDGRFHVCVSGKPIFADDGSFLGYRGTVSDETELIETRERALRADTRLRDAVENIAEGFVIYDKDDRLVVWNDAYRKMYPENADRMVVGSRYEDSMRAALAAGRYPEAKGREEAWLAERLRKHREPGEPEETRLSDGRWVLRSERRMSDGSIAGLRIDITALKQAQDSLRESQLMLNRAQKLSGTGSVVHNLVTKKTEWSDEIYRIFGVERATFEARTENFLALIHPEDRAQVEALISQGAQAQADPPCEFRIVRPDSTIRWVHREADFWGDGGTPTIRLTTYKDITEKREADLRHRELEILLRDAIESISEGFVLYDKDDRLVLCNEAFRRLYPNATELLKPGARYEDILRSAANRRLDGREEWLARRLAQHRAPGEPVETQIEDGRWVLISERRTSSGGTAGLRVDVTAVKTAQNTLREKEAILSRAQHVAKLGTAVRNLSDNTLNWSDEMFRIFGVDPSNGALAAPDFLALVHPEDRAIAEDAIKRSNEDVTGRAYEYRIIRPDGAVRWLYSEGAPWHDADGAVIGWLAIFQDITELNATRVSLREKEAMLSRAQRVANVGCAVHDYRNRKSQWSEQMYRITGLDPDSFVPNPDAFLALVHPDDRALVDESLVLGREGNAIPPLEYRLVRSDDAVRWVHREAEIMRDADGKPIGRLSTFQDITELKTAQDSLRGSQAALARAQRVAKTGSIMRDLATGKVEWSEEMFRLFGVSRETFPTAPEGFLALAHPDDRGKLAAALDAGTHGQATPPLEYRAVLSDGTERWLRRESDVLCDDEDQAIALIATFTDITERHAAEQRQRELEVLLRDAIESISEGFVIYDANDRLVICNEGYRRLYPEIADLIVPGVQYADLLHARLARGYRPKNNGRDEDWIAQMLHRRRSSSEPHEVQTCSGRWILVAERPMSGGGLAGLRVDITRMKEVQQSLHDSQTRLHRTQQIAHIGAVERNLRTSEVIWSDETYRIFGVDPATYTPSAEKLLDFVHPEDRSLVIDVLRRRHQEHVNSSMRFRIVRPNGDQRMLQSQADVIYDEAGQPIYISIAMMDITDKELASQRQTELEMQLRHSEKLTALGTLAGGIAHDLNNTLVPIQALSKLAMQEIPEDAPARIDLETIHQASLQARDLVRQILAFSRKQEMLAAPTDVALRMREALQMLRASVPSTIEIVENIAPIAPISADGTQLQQIVVNLVTNGAHAIGNNFGRVTVTLEEPTSEPEISRMIRLKVADTGCGMSPEIVHRMFEPFFTTKSVGEGTGLGLSVVHGIVTSLGGTIDVKSVPGEGTEFTITLPVKSVDEDMDIAAVA
jgi:PAS domain S-box-containing protein